MTLVNHVEKIVIFMAEKCASTSIRNALIDQEGWERIEHKPVWDWFYHVYQCFITIRDPYERAYSYWKYRLRTGVTSATFEQFVCKRCLRGCYLDLSSLDNWFSHDMVKWSARLYVGPEFGKWWGSWPELKKYKIGVDNASNDPSFEYAHIPVEKYWFEEIQTQEALEAINEWAGDDFWRFEYDKYKSIAKLHDMIRERNA